MHKSAQSSSSPCRATRRSSACRRSSGAGGLTTGTAKFRPDIAIGSWTTLTGTTQSDNGTQRTVTDTGATGAKKFYHIEITKP